MPRTKLKTILPDDDEINISKHQMTMLMMESYKKSSTSAEEILCLKEVAKLNDLYDAKPQSLTLINIQQDVKKLEVMSDEELLRIAGTDRSLFERPEPKMIEADYVEVKDENDKG